MPFSTEISGLLSSSVKNCIRYKIGLTEQFLSELYVQYGLEKKNMSIRFKDNTSNLFSTLVYEPIKNKLESLNKECKLAISFKENIPELAFELYSLDNWTIREKTAQQIFLT